MEGQWITYPSPTAEDGDEDGDVLIQLDDGDFRVAHWDRVLPYQPWMRIQEFQKQQDFQKQSARKMVQLLAVKGYGLVALSDDGAAFHLYFGGPSGLEWRPLPPLPPQS
jgi:hypothetical protein